MDPVPLHNRTGGQWMIAAVHCHGVHVHCGHVRIDARGGGRGGDGGGGGGICRTTPTPLCPRSTTHRWGCGW